MKKIINKKVLELVAESQKFGINDKLSEVLDKQDDFTVELSEEDLSFVSAASGKDYEMFMQMLKNRNS